MRGISQPLTEVHSALGCLLQVYICFWVAGLFKRLFIILGIPTAAEKWVFFQIDSDTNSCTLFLKLYSSMAVFSKGN